MVQHATAAGVRSDSPEPSGAVAPQQSGQEDRPFSLTWYVCLPLAAVAALLIVVGPLLRYQAAVRRRSNPDESALLPTLFDVNTEGNLPSWFSSSLWLLVALAAVTVAVLLPTGARMARVWVLLALFFTFCSLDEAASLHERLLGGVGEAAMGGERGDLLHFAWVVPGAAVAVLAVAAFGRLVWSLPVRQRTMLLVAGAVFVGGALGAESLSGAVLRAYGDGRLYVAVTSLEEASEMAAVILLLAALLSLVRLRRGATGLRLALVPITSTAPPPE